MKNSIRILPVLLAGGSGNRLWPLSRELFPKQFLSLTDERSLLQNTVLRAQALDEALPPLLVCGEAHRFIVAEQLRQIEVAPAAILLEPEGRNSAPAAAVAAHWAMEHLGPDTLLFLMAADHVVDDPARLAASLRAATPAAAAGRIVTFGVVPTRPETGYGYIQAGAHLPEGGLRVQRFVEKPPLETAQRYLDEGGYWWNSGMFLFRADTLLQELSVFEPAMAHHAEIALLEAQHDLDFVRLAARHFTACRKESIDYALMEKTQRAAVVPLDAGWDDVGAWTFLDRLPASDAAGNRVHGDVMLQDAGNNLVHSSSRLVAMVGVQDHIVVETADAVLVSTREHAQDVRLIVQKLKALSRAEAQTLPRVYRPWGWYETLTLGDRFQVKRIMVHPGGQLSLQMHHHRAEHWVVVRGTAAVTCGEQVSLLSENQSTYIALGQRHRLANPGHIPLELIEVQSGAYLGEDDIVRYEDAYGRTAPAIPVTAAAAAPPASGSAGEQQQPAKAADPLLALP